MIILYVLGLIKYLKTRVYMTNTGNFTCHIPMKENEVFHDLFKSPSIFLKVVETWIWTEILFKYEIILIFRIFIAS